MYAKVCDICNTIIMNSENKLLNGNDVLIHMHAETGKYGQNFDLCRECFFKRFHGDYIGISVNNQILKEKEENKND